MATNTGTFYIRPSADVSLTHPVYPETLGAGYLAINEAVSDETATYIGVVESDGLDFDYTSTFKMHLDCEYKIKSITSAKFIFKGVISGGSNLAQGTSNIAECVCDVTFGGAAVFSGRRNHDSYGLKEDTLIDADMPNLASALNDYFSVNHTGSMPDILISVRNWHREGGGKNSSCYVTQVAIELTCEYVTGFDMHDKATGTWNQVQAAYQKRNGSWVEISEDECKATLSGASLILRKT